MISKQQLKSYRSLQNKKDRSLQGKFIIEGINLCEAALNSNFSIEILLFSENLKDEKIFLQLKDISKKKGVPYTQVPDTEIKKMSDSVSPQGILGIVDIPDRSIFDLWELNPEEILILDRINDPGNLGTIFRTASWFGVKSVICSQECADIYNGKVLRSSAGSFFQLPLILHNMNLFDLLENLIKRKYAIWVSSSSTGKSYLDVDYSRPLALVVGNERFGVQKYVYDFPVNKVCIPRLGKGESLNVGIATSIILSEIFRNIN